MNEACDQTTTPHPAKSDFILLAASLEEWFESEEKFAKLPEDVQKRIAGAMGLSIPTDSSLEEARERAQRAEKFRTPVTLFSDHALSDYDQKRNLLDSALSIAAPLWDVSSPSQRRVRAQRRDIESHPKLAPECTVLWKKSLEISDCKLTASDIPLAKRKMADVKIQKEELGRLLEEEAALTATLQRKAQSLGLAWPYASAAEAFVCPGHDDLAGWTEAAPTSAIASTALKEGSAVGSSKPTEVDDLTPPDVERQPRNAPEPRIRLALRIAYTDRKDDPPNIKKIAPFVHRILLADGWSASGAQIMKIAVEPEFKRLRRPVGIKRQ